MRLFLLGLLLFSLSSLKPGENVPAEVQQLASRFTEATLKKDITALAECLDSAYMKQELEGLYGGNTTLFFDQFYGGYRSGGEGFVTIPLEKIKDIILVGIHEEKGIWKLSFGVESKKERIQLELSAIMRLSGGKTVYGLAGNRG